MREIENQKTDASSKPYAEVRILSCGELIPKSKGKVELCIYIDVNDEVILLASSLLVAYKIFINLFVMDGGAIGKKVNNTAIWFVS